MSMWKYERAFDPVPEAARLTLGEGDTPLVRSRSLGPRAGLENLWFKLEFCNPTGSYKDRFACVAISDMVARGKTRCIATSSGNTGASLAAYCAAAGIACEIAIVEGAPLGKLSQMLAYGAKIFRVRGFGISVDVTNRVYETLTRLGRHPQAQMQISGFRYSPVGMSGVRSLSYELAAQRSGAIDHVFCQAGGGGLVLAVAQGFFQLHDAGQIGRLPRVECVQPEGNDTIAGAIRSGAERSREVECTTRVSGLQVPTIVDGDAVIQATRRTGGNGHLVRDEDVWAIQKRLAREEGIFCEPAGVVPIAGALKAAANGEIAPGAHVVCLLTGSGFKDPASVERMIQDVSCPLIDVSELETRRE